MRATCGWDRGRSGQGKYKEGACRCGGVSDWDEARRARRCVEKTVRGMRLEAKTEPNVQLSSFSCKMQFSRFKTGMRTTADSVLFCGTFS